MIALSSIAEAAARDFFASKLGTEFRHHFATAFPKAGSEPASIEHAALRNMKRDGWDEGSAYLNQIAEDPDQGPDEDKRAPRMTDMTTDHDDEETESPAA